MRLVFDIEADGLLDTIKRIHCIIAKDVDTGEVHQFADQEGYAPVAAGVDLLASADQLIGHNILSYDIPAIHAVTGVDLSGKNLLDTMVACRTALPDPSDWDMKLIKAGRLHPSLRKSHSLKAWGQRLGNHKFDFGTGGIEDWAEWTREMQDYCVQDVETNTTIFEWIESQDIPQAALDTEHAMERLCRTTEHNGFLLDRRAAEALLQELQVLEAEAEDVLARQCGRIFVRNGGEFTPKVTNDKKGHVADCPMTKVKSVSVNPTSRDQLIRVLQYRYGWKPTSYTPNGKPQLAEDHIASLPVTAGFKEAISRVYKIAKIKGYVWTNPTKKKLTGWLQIADENGFVHGRTNPCGCVTARPAYFAPNMGQIPKVRKGKDGILKGIEGGFGWDCRNVWTAPPGKLLIGSDLSGLELRMLAHFLFAYDGGAYADVVLNGDVHTVNQEMAGLSSRDAAKTFIYAWLYGAGDWLIGTFDPPKSKEECQRLYAAAPQRVKNFAARQLRGEFNRAPTTYEVCVCLKGREIKETFFQKLPALGALREDVITRSKGYAVSREAPRECEKTESRTIVRRKWNKKARQWTEVNENKPTWIYTEASKRWWKDCGDGGFIRGLDGRKVIIRSDHSALNFLLQGGGALVCKRWLILTDEILQQGHGWRNALDGDYARHGWVHDEQNNSASPDNAPIVRQACIDAAPLAGRHFNLRVPIAAEAAIGRTWADVH
ncbi:MAG: hypothetical protein KDG54_11180 [Geminicoccaceae bacterium]|nr:hypothetical protein [Geminicoccaceae bacterium]